MKHAIAYLLIVTSLVACLEKEKSNTSGEIKEAFGVSVHSGNCPEITSAVYDMQRDGDWNSFEEMESNYKSDKETNALIQSAKACGGV